VSRFFYATKSESKPTDGSSGVAQSESDMTKNAEKLFNKGIIKSDFTGKVSEQYKGWDKKSNGPDQTETLLTTEMKNTAEMEMMIDDLHRERLIPSACAQFYGAKDRGELLEEALYKPSVHKECLKQRLGVIEKEIGKYTELADQLDSMNGLSTETRSELATTKNELSEAIGRYESQFTDLTRQLNDPSLDSAQRTGINNTLELLTLQLEEAKTKHEALLPFSKTDEELSSQASSISGTPLSLDGLKELIKAKQTALIDKKTSFQDYTTWPPYRLAAVTEADSLIISKRGSLLSTQTNLRETTEKWNGLQNELQNAQHELNQLEQFPSQPEQAKKDAQTGELPGKISNLQKQIGLLKEKIPGLSNNEKSLRNDLNKIQTQLLELTEKAKNEKWDQPSCQEIVNFVNKNNPELIQFDRIRVKVNGQILPLTGSPSEKNLNIFKEALKKLALTKTPPLEISDDQIKEMITLCSREKTVQGTPAGSASAGDGLPSFGVNKPLITGDIDCYEIVIPDDSPTSIDFQFHSVRALLSKIQFQGGGATVDEQLISFSHRDGGTFENGTIPNDFQQFERSCSFTYRYTPKISSDGQNINMEHGNLDLIKSQQAYWPIRLMPAIISKSFEEQLNNPNKVVHLYAYRDQSVGPESDPSTISYQFYRDLSSPSSPYLLTDKTGTTTPLYEAYNLDSTNQDEQRSLERNEASNKFIDFIGDKDQALEVSRIVNQAWLGTLFSEMNTAVGPFQLDGQSGIPALKNPTYTISKPQEGRVVAHVAFKSKPNSFSFLDNNKDPVVLNDKKSSAEINYDITFLFDPPNSKEPPSISISPISYDYHFEKSAEDS
jgi:predicted  nucleic acid-binding Zn-ribbon protein